jgi:hypothetical protein
MKSINGLRIRSLVTKRLADYQAKVVEAQEFLKSERLSILSGAKKAQLSEWWLQAIQEKVTMFLEEQGYDASAVPTNYINEPPKSMWLVQKNLDLVRRWMRPQTEGDAKILKSLIRSISNQVYPQLDRFLTNTEFLIMVSTPLFSSSYPILPLFTLHSLIHPHPSFLARSSLLPLLVPHSSLTLSLQEQIPKLPTTNPLPEMKSIGPISERLDEIKDLIRIADVCLTILVLFSFLAVLIFLLHFRFLGGLGWYF